MNSLQIVVSFNPCYKAELFFGRLDYQDKDKRLKDKTMELVWMGSENLGMHQYTAVHKWSIP